MTQSSTFYQMPDRLAGLYREAGYTETDCPRADLRKYQRGNRTHIVKLSSNGRVLAVTIDGHPCINAGRGFAYQLEEGLLAEITERLDAADDLTEADVPFETKAPIPNEKLDQALAHKSYADSLEMLPKGSVIVRLLSAGEAMSIPFGTAYQRYQDGEWYCGSLRIGLTSRQLAERLPGGYRTVYVPPTPRSDR